MASILPERTDIYYKWRMRCTCDSGVLVCTKFDRALKSVLRSMVA